MGSDYKITLLAEPKNMQEVTELVNMGFEKCAEQYGRYYYTKYIPLDDPDLKIIEERIDYKI